MSTVTIHAAPVPMTRTQNNQDCHVGSGSLFCQQSKAYAALTDMENCNHCTEEA